MNNFNKYTGVIDDVPFWSAPFGIKLFEKLIMKKNITALDIGFGSGFPLIELAMRLGDSCKIYGIDPWEEIIKIAKRKINTYGIKNIKIIKGEAENIPLNDNSVDLIVSNNGLNNVQDIKRSLLECYRIMKNTGQMVLTQNLEDSMIEFYEIMEKVLIRNNLKNEVKKIKSHIYEKRKPLKELKDLLKDSGFIITDTEKDEFSYMFNDGTTMFNHYFIKLAFLPYWKNIINNFDTNQIFSEIEQEINLTADKKGYFKLSVPFVIVSCKK